MTRLLRSAFVIARRDFTATVFSKTFIFFLLGPLFPLVVGGLFGGVGAQVAARTERPVVAVMFAEPDFARLAAARERIAPALEGPKLVKLVHYPPAGDFDSQVRALLKSRTPPVRAVLAGSLDRPRVIGPVAGDPTLVGQLRLIVGDARAPQPSAPQVAVTNVAASSGSLARDQAVTAQVGQMALFFLSILLSGMLLSQLIEEKSNKIIEVIAAAVPIDALFLGKLFAMLAASLLGMLVWFGAGALLVGTLKTGGLAALPPPAVGWPAFLALGLIYFAMNYLLLGALFLAIGAQAGTAREVQILSMPVTVGQVLVFGFASTAVGAPDSTLARAAAIFPWSSPMTMIAHAAERPGLAPHLLAIAWQALWVALILNLGARLFRRLVLKSGGPRHRRAGKASA